jgi:hypothetical protein
MLDELLVGWEAQILREGELIGRTFLLKEAAIRWAEAEKVHTEKGGD